MFPGNALEISAATGKGIDELLAKLDETVNGGKKLLTLFFPHSESGRVSDLYRLATVQEVEYTEDGTVATALCDERAQGMFTKFVHQKP